MMQLLRVARRRNATTAATTPARSTPPPLHLPSLLVDRASWEAATAAWVPILQQRAAARDTRPLLVRHVGDMRALRTAMDVVSVQRHGRTARVGFVPTMGALHAGHLTLCDLARAGGSSAEAAAHRATGSDFLVSSIFVNPTQFAPHEDLSTYPRTLDADVAKLEGKGVDVVFAPLATQMYPLGAPFRSFVELSGVDATSPEGGARPGFFRGVATVVTKLLALVAPTSAAFGQKDGVQCIAIRTLARDLNLPVSILIGATSRESDGLAMSSRNVYLSPEQRAAAPAIFRGLRAAQRELEHSPEGVAALAAARHAAAARLNASTASEAAGAVDAGAAEAAAQAAAHTHGKQGGGNMYGTVASAGVVVDPMLARLAAVVEKTIREEVRGGVHASHHQAERNSDRCNSITTASHHCSRLPY